MNQKRWDKFKYLNACFSASLMMFTKNQLLLIMTHLHASAIFH